MLNIETHELHMH